MAFYSIRRSVLRKVDGYFVGFALFEAGYFSGLIGCRSNHNGDIKDLWKVNFVAYFPGKIGAGNKIYSRRSGSDQMDFSAKYRVIACIKHSDICLAWFILRTSWIENDDG